MFKLFWPRLRGVPVNIKRHDLQSSPFVRDDSFRVQDNLLGHARFCLYPPCLSPSRRSRVQPQLPVWGAEGPRCQPWWMASDRSTHAYPVPFFSSIPFVCVYVFFDASFPCLVRCLQPWITPSLFDNTGNNNIVDEWTFGQLQDRNTAQQKLQAHWDTWITEADFAAIAAAGYVSYDEPTMSVSMLLKSLFGSSA